MLPSLCHVSKCVLLSSSLCIIKQTQSRYAALTAVDHLTSLHFACWGAWHLPSPSLQLKRLGVHMQGFKVYILHTHHGLWAGTVCGRALPAPCVESMDPSGASCTCDMGLFVLRLPASPN